VSIRRSLLGKCRWRMAASQHNLGYVHVHVPAYVARCRCCPIAINSMLTMRRFSQMTCEPDGCPDIPPPADFSLPSAGDNVPPGRHEAEEMLISHVSYPPHTQIPTAVYSFNERGTNGPMRALSGTFYSEESCLVPPGTMWCEKVRVYPTPLSSPSC
jgi:hypothetical protein